MSVKLNQEKIATLVVAAQNREANAFDLLVTLFQDLAVGYSFSILGDWHLAEDAAQEALIEAHFRLSGLRNPEQFIPFLRQILFKQCDRIRRSKKVSLCDLEETELAFSGELTPPDWIERREKVEQIRSEIALLPEAQRQAVILFYIGEHSQREVAQFLNVPVSTVKKRLHDARRQLKRRLLKMLQNDLRSERPSNTLDFALKVRQFTGDFSENVSGGESLVRSLLIAADNQKDAGFANVIRQVQRDVSGNGEFGLTLSQAMSKHGEFFNPDYIATIRNGEIEGNLKIVLQQLAND